MLTRKQFNLPETPKEDKQLLGYVEKLKRAVLDIFRDLNIPGSLFITQSRIENCEIENSSITDLTADLLPATDETYDLGSTTQEWQDLWIDGTANIDSLVADTADINGGTVDGTVIGGASAAAGTFTTVTSAGAVLHSAANRITDAIGIVNIYSTDAVAADKGGSLGLGGETGQGTTPYVFGTVAGRKDGADAYAGYLQFSTTAATSGAIVERMRLTSDGRIYGTALHNNAGAVTGTTNQYIASGTYTPTLTNGTNVASSTAEVCQWIRVGNVVTVSGSVLIDPTAASAALSLVLTLPIASTWAAAPNCGGAGGRGASGDSCVINPDNPSGGTKAELQGIPSFDSNDRWHFTFTYLVL